MSVGAQPASEPVPAWQRKATVVVYLLVAAAFVYIGWAWMTQRKYNGLMFELMSADAARSEAASKALAESDDSLPYLAGALVNDAKPERRVLAARTILRRLRTAVDEGGSKGRPSPVPDLEAVTRALSDESPAVREQAATVVEFVGIRADYQRARLEEMRHFEELLKGLASPDNATRAAAAESFRRAGDRALPFLVGTLLSSDKEYARRGLESLKACALEVLKSSNQPRIVPLLERRRCGLLLAALPGEDAEGRSTVLELLNISGRLPKDFFGDFMSIAPTLDAPERDKLVNERILFLESAERLKGDAADKIGR